MASLKDIATELDVSVSLVSKVLNGRLGNTGVRPEVVSAIRDKASEMNYHKNTSALALQEGRHNVIGTFIHRHGNPGSGVISSLLKGLSSEMTKNKQRQFLDFFTEVNEISAYRDLIHPSMMDGMIIGGLAHEELAERLLDIHRIGLPIVTIHNKQMHPQLPNVTLDEVEIGRLATDHLIQQGCRRIGHIREFKMRSQGYTQALAAHNIPLDESLIYSEEDLSFSYEKGKRAAQFFIDSQSDLDGFVAQSDEEAIGAMHVFMNAGKSVPNDIRIIGVDDAPYCKFCRVPLSSISQNGEARGKMAAQILLSLIEGKDPLPSATVQPILCPRASSA